MIDEFNGYGIVAAVLIIAFSIAASFVGILYNSSKRRRKKGMKSTFDRWNLGFHHIMNVKARRNIRRIYLPKYF